MTYIMSCVWLDYMVKYFQCKNCVGSSLKTKKCVASFLVKTPLLSEPLGLDTMVFFVISLVFKRLPKAAFRFMYWDLI